MYVIEFYNKECMINILKLIINYMKVNISK